MIPTLTEAIQRSEFMYNIELKSDAVVSTFTSQQQGTWSQSDGPFLCGVYMFSQCILGVLPRYSCFLPQSKDKLIQFTSDSENPHRCEHDCAW